MAEPTLAGAAVQVYHIETWKEHTERAKQRQLARDRFCMSRGQGKTAAAAAAAVGAADAAAAQASRYQATGCAGGLQQEGRTRSEAGSRAELDVQGSGAGREATSIAGLPGNASGGGSNSGVNQEGPKLLPYSPGACKARRLTRIRSLQVGMHSVGSTATVTACGSVQRRSMGGWVLGRVPEVLEYLMAHCSKRRPPYSTLGLLRKPGTCLFLGRDACDSSRLASTSC